MKKRIILFVYNSAEYNMCHACLPGDAIRSHWLAVRFVGRGGNGTGAVAQRGCPAAPAAGGYRSLLSEQYPGRRERRQSGSLSAGSSAGYWTSGRTYSQ